MSNLKSIDLTVLELLAFIHPKFRGLRDTGHASFSKKILMVVFGLTVETCLSNMMSVALTVLELFAFNAQKFRGSRDRSHAPPFEKILRGYVRTVPGNMLVKFEVHSVSSFGTISI